MIVQSHQTMEEETIFKTIQISIKIWEISSKIKITIKTRINIKTVERQSKMNIKV